VTVELVHLILKTVSEYTVGTTKGSEKVYQGYDFKNKNSFTLDAIEIENPENWTVGTPQAKSNYKKIDIKAANLAEGSASLTNDEKSLLVINEDMVVTEYAPDVFAYLRNLDFPSTEYNAEEIFKQSLNPEENKDMVFKAGES